jgi:hypothetical protein
MLSVTCKPSMLIVIKMIVLMLSVVLLSVAATNIRLALEHFLFLIIS